MIAKKADEGTASAAEIEEKARLVDKVATLNQSFILSSSQADLKPHVYFHIREESTRMQAQRLADELEGVASVVVPGIQRVDVGPEVSELRYFKSSEEQEAREIASGLSSLGLKVEVKYIQGFEALNKIRPRHYELWISTANL